MSLTNLSRSDWNRVRLGDLVRRSRTQVDPVRDGFERYVAGGHIDTDSVVIDRFGDPTDGQMGSTFRYVFEPGQVLFLSARPYLRKTGVPQFGGVVADKTYVLSAIPENGLLNEFLPFLLTSEPFIAYANREATGSMNPRLLWGATQRYEFDLPPLEDQKRFADTLWAVEAHRRSLASQRDAVKGVGQKLRDARFESRDRSISLKNYLVGITAGRSFAAAPVAVDSGKYLVLKVSAVGAEGFVGTETKELLDQSGFMPRFALRKGDLLVTRANTSDYVGRPAIVDSDYPNVMLSDKTLRLDLDLTKARPNFLREFLLTSQTRAAISEVASGTGAAMKNISQDQIRALAIPRFSLEEQDALLAEFEVVNRALDRLDAELTALHELQNALSIDFFGRG